MTWFLDQLQAGILTAATAWLVLFVAVVVWVVPVVLVDLLTLTEAECAAIRHHVAQKRPVPGEMALQVEACMARAYETEVCDD